jgi:SAM-dependent methyltransferase
MVSDAAGEDARTGSGATAPLDRIARYYSEKLSTFGPTARGVDWRDEEGQERRFRELLRVVGSDSDASLVEIGCGYGALARYLRRQGFNGSYLGLDVAPEMIAAAARHCADLENTRFATGSAPSAPADYVVASGIFNVRLDVSDAEWETHVFRTIDLMAAFAARGIAFNCLTRFSDAERMRPTLWYPDPGLVLGRCIERFGNRVALAHDYGMWEFTIRVRLGETRA